MKRLLLFLLMLGCVTFGYAQQLPEPLPIDTNVRYGVLDNGLTYYIRHNETSKQRAEFYIAQKVGSILEEESQRGLAHFLEHMAFNGTKHFPGKGILNYLESIGVKFGVNINAYTSIDETVYNLSEVPVIREGIVDSCLLVLADWASQISLEDKEIDSERGVIREEWRTSDNAAMRNYAKLLPVMYGNESRYANRLPIGLPEVIDNFSYQTLRDYYDKWYRPDLQGIIVVGDIDVDNVEKKVKELFGAIKLPDNKAERVWFKVDNNKEPVVAVAADKEQTRTQVSIYYKHDEMPVELKRSVVGLVANYMRNVVGSMYGTRIAEITQKPNAPFIAAQVADGDFFIATTKKAMLAIAICKEDGVDGAIDALATEVAKVDKYGFTPSEYERAKAEYITALDNAYAERAKQKNETYVNEYLDHFLYDGSIAGIETEYELLKQMIPTIPIEVINNYAQSLVSEDNVVISVMLPKKEGVVVPTADHLKEVFVTARGKEIEAYVDEMSDKPLVASEPKAGSVKKTIELEPFGATEWVLSNGARVIVKPTDFKDDQILMKAESKGGYSLLGESDATNVKVFGSAVELGGLGEFSAIDLSKVLAGKRASIAADLDQVSENLSGSSSVKDLETLMQLIYLSFTAPHQDIDAFASWKERMKGALNNAEANPMATMTDSLMSTLYNNNPFVTRLTATELDRVDYDRINQIYKERFADASDFVFTFVGNVNVEQLKPLVEKYIASLPSLKSREKYRDMGLNVVAGKRDNFFTKQMSTPKSSVYVVLSGKCDYTPENAIKMSLLRQLLSNTFIETLREDEGGTYGAGVGGSIDPSDNTYVVKVVFDTNAEKRDVLMSIVARELKKIAETGPTEENLAKMREYLLKTYKDNLRDNEYWLSAMGRYTFYGQNVVKDYEANVSKQTVESIRDFAKQLFSQNNVIQVVMNGESATK